ncbi:hypothetical protein C806_02723 [Lachnospiraceae bacterium 3-1]|nr:hypothetical protein C806_02723 [Lachnospiraceae bacterium 3-1]
MYSAYFDMITSVYQNYYDENGRCKAPNIKREEVYDFLTCEPPQEGNRYFDSVSKPLAQSFQKISQSSFINWNGRQYYFIDPGNGSPQSRFLVARVVANLISQTTAIKIACQLYDYCQNQQYPQITQTIYQYKILLGNNSNRAVKMDKIVIYNKIPLSPKGECPPISKILGQQMKYLSHFCSKHAGLPQFVWQPSRYSPVGFGEGIAYHRQDMTFSEPRADGVYDVITKTKSKNISPQEFQDLLSKEFKKRGLSDNIPFINHCTKEAETKWLIL